MLELTQRNWLSYSINGEAWGKRSAPEDKFEVKLTLPTDMPKELPPFHEAIADAAECIAEASVFEHKSKGITVFYSGGIDSEISLRSLYPVCKRRRIPLRAVTLEFPDHMNAEDVATAVKLCRELNIRHEVVPHDVARFAEESMCESMARLHTCSQIAYLSVLRYVNWYEGDTVVLGGEILLQKHWVKGVPDWYFVYREDEDALTYRFSEYFNIPVINEFMSYTPELFFSWLLHPAVQDVFNNSIYKLSMISSKNAILKLLYFDALGIQPAATTKRHGYEQMLVLNERMQERFRSQLLPMQEARIPVRQLMEMYRVRA